MICKDCVHFDVCKDATVPNPEYKGVQPDKSKECRGFKNKSDYAEVKNGHWIKRGNEKKCSVCGFIYYSNNDDWNGCPNCLAKMDGGRDT